MAVEVRVTTNVAGAKNHATQIIVSKRIGPNQEIDEVIQELIDEAKSRMPLDQSGSQQEPWEFTISYGYQQIDQNSTWTIVTLSTLAHPAKP